MSIIHLSTEILQKIYEYANVKDVLHLAQTSKKNYRAYLGRQMHILERTMHNSFSPLPDLYRLVISSEPQKTRKPIGTEVRRNLVIDRIIQAQETPRLTVELIIKMTQYGKVAEKWTEIYPQIRWRSNSNNRRLLRPSEQERLRGAIYRYWTYNNLFHDQTFVRFDPDLPSSRDDPRFHILRNYTTIELAQLTEYVDKMRQILQVDLYPSNAMVRHRFSQPVPPRTLANLGWGDGIQHTRLVLDLMKYSPADLLHLFEKTSTKKERFEYMVSHGLKYFMDAPATLRDSIAMVIFERKTQVGLDSSVFDEEAEFGIIDAADGAGPGFYDGHRYASDSYLDGGWWEEYTLGRPVWMEPDTEDEDEDEDDED